MSENIPILWSQLAKELNVALVNNYPMSYKAGGGRQGSQKKRHDCVNRSPPKSEIMVIILIVKFLILTAFCDAMTMKQIKSTGKMIRKTCQPKNNVEDAKIDPIANGEFIDDKDVKCYMACVMKMANTVKNGKLNYDAAMKQADLLLPEEIKEPAKAALTACKKIMDQHKDICEAAFHMTKCIYKQNPDIFYFP